MTISIEAVVKKGQLELKDRVALPEGTPVRVTVEENADPLAPVIGIGESGRTDGADQHDKHI